MKIASILENQNIEKRIAVTPEIAKKYISLGFEVLLVNKYADHLGIKDEEYFLEAKSRQNLNIHQSLEKAIEKSGDKNTVLFWKKLKRKQGNARRTNDGIPEVVSMSYDLFIKLLNSK